MNRVCIYILRDPKDRKPRYIGKTTNPKRRLQSHLFIASTVDPRWRRDDHVQRWIRKVLAAGRRPELAVLEEVDSARWAERERFWIGRFRLWGIRLTNVTAGGESIDIPHTKEWHAKIGAALRGRKYSKEFIERIRQSLLARSDRLGCKKGHPWTTENTYWRQKGTKRFRVCRQCSLEGAKRWRRETGRVKGRSKQTCKRGHVLSGDNLRELQRKRRVERICRECVHIRNRAAKRRARLRKVAA